MKTKQFLALILSVIMAAVLIPTGIAFAEDGESAAKTVYDFSYSAPCSTENEASITVGGEFPEDMKITGFSVDSLVIVKSASATYSESDASVTSVKFKTRITSNPTSGTLIFTFHTENYGDITVNILITLAGDEDEAIYQAELDGEWLNGAFSEAVNSVYDGGTVKLMKDVYLTETVTIGRSMTLTSADTSDPKMITSSTDGHGYLLLITADAAIENLIVDGGSANGITASRALIAVGSGTNAGTLTLGSGSIIRGNNNTASPSDYVYGGGIVVILGRLCINSGTITGNSARFGGGIYALENTVLEISGGRITGNTAVGFAGGIECCPSSKIILTGAPVINGNVSSEEDNDGGLYIDGNDTVGYANVVIGKLTENAAVNFYTWNPSAGFLIASPADNYSITAADMSKLNYIADEYILKLNDDGIVELSESSAQPSYKNTVLKKITADMTTDNSTATAVRSEINPNGGIINEITWTCSDYSGSYNETKISGESTVYFGIVVPLLLNAAEDSTTDEITVTVK